MEFYAGIMALHVWISQYTIISSKTVPSREHIGHIFKLLDTDHSGFLDFEEFQNVVVVMFQNVASRICAQMIIKLVIAPFVGVMLVEIATALAEEYPSELEHIQTFGFLIPLLASKTIGIALGAAVVNMIFLPYVMNLHERIFLLHVENDNLLQYINALNKKLSIERGSTATSNGTANKQNITYDGPPPTGVKHKMNILSNDILETHSNSYSSKTHTSSNFNSRKKS